MSISDSAIARTSAGVSSPRLGLDCKNASSGLPNRRRPIMRGGRSGTFGLRTRISTLSGENSCLRDLGQLAVRHPLVGRAQILADIGGEVVDLAIEQRLGHRIGRRGFGRKHAHFCRRAGLLDHQLQRLRRQVRQIGVVPAFLHAGEGELHAADVRRDLEPLLAQPVAQKAGRAIKQRIAGREHNDPLARRAVSILRTIRVQVAADFDLLGFAGRGRRERPACAAISISALSRSCRAAGGQSFESIVADTDDVDLALDKGGSFWLYR